MTSVVRILRSKPEQTVHTIAPTAMVLDALKLMAEKNIGALVVTEGEQVCRDHHRARLCTQSDSHGAPPRKRPCARS